MHGFLNYLNYKKLLGRKYMNKIKLENPIVDRSYKPIKKLSMAKGLDFLLKNNSNLKKRPHTVIIFSLIILLFGGGCSFLMDLMGYKRIAYTETGTKYKKIPEPPFLQAYHLPFWGVSGILSTKVNNSPAIDGVLEGFPAEVPAIRAKVQKNDIFIEINGTPIHTLEEVKEKLKGDPGTLMKLTVKGWGKRKTFSYKLGFSNGLECIKIPQNTVKVKMVETKGYSVGADTAYKRTPLAYKKFTITAKSYSISKTIQSNAHGDLNISLRDYYSNFSAGSDLILIITSPYRGKDTVEITIPHEYLEIVYKREEEAGRLLKQAKTYYKKGGFKEALELCSNIKKKYKETGTAKEAENLSKTITERRKSLRESKIRSALAEVS